MRIQYIDDFDYIKTLEVDRYTIKKVVYRVMKDFGYRDEHTRWGMEKFIQSLLESLKSADPITPYYSEYQSPDECYIIKNNKIPDLLTSRSDQDTFLNALNSLQEFKENPLSPDDVFCPYPPHKLDRFNGEYTVIGNREWCNSNINWKNIEYEYKLG